MNMNKIPVVRIKLQREKDIHSKRVIMCPNDVCNIIHEVLDGADREYFGVICLNTKNQVLNVNIAHMGTLNSANVHPREVFKGAILSNSASIIIFHNHPSGYTTPSKEDINITMRLIESGKILGIEVLDHIIVGCESSDGYYSYKEEN